MRLRHGSLIALLTSVLLVATCGHQMATPTPGSQSARSGSPSELDGPADRLVPDDDWHALGSSDAPVTIVECSDFQ